MLTDDDRMPSGKHTGQKLRDVPASYLIWLADNLKPVSLTSRDRWKPILEYIEANRGVLEAEIKDTEKS